MTGFSVPITAPAFEPRSLRISFASRCRCFATDPLDGLTRVLPTGYRRKFQPRKSKPWLRWTILVLSSFRERPLSASHPASLARMLSACCLE